MTTHLLMFGFWMLATGAFAMGMTARELKTDRARAQRLEDSALDPNSVKWSGALGLVVAVLLCLVASW